MQCPDAASWIAGLGRDRFDAAIFDMDGLLIDSEPFWQRAEREAFAEVGIAITQDMSRVTAPMTTAQVAAHWFGHRPWRGPSQREMEQRVIGRVAALVTAHGRALPGARETLQACRALGWRVALASNSPLSLCHHTLQALGLRTAFDAIVSADQVECGKPAPDIYHFAARQLQADEARCLVFEDSVPGVRAARLAGMTVIAVPSQDQVFDGGQPAPHWVLPSLSAALAPSAKAGIFPPVERL
ncbi:MAG: hexitol phosphatase HxpB [Burkholderiaceae bacterium]|nr:hexitol phosphatase HxpB [Burkholderiaceae bacterium]